MNREIARTMLLMLLCIIGGIFIGLNASNLSSGLGAGLFGLGVAIVASAVTFEGFFLTIWKRKSNFKK